MSLFTTILLIFAVSQGYWIWRGYSLAARIRSRRRRMAVCAGGLAIYLLAYEFNFGIWHERATPVHLTFGDAFLNGPFLCWAASSLVAFLLVVLFAVARAIAAGVVRMSGMLGMRHAVPDIP